MDVCPKCGSRNLTKIDRMNGYLSYSRVKGDTRLNDAKMAEIAERKEHVKMRYHNITKDDMLNGEGLRVVLWVAGCAHACPGCHNPIPGTRKAVLPFDQAAKASCLPSWQRIYLRRDVFRR